MVKRIWKKLELNACKVGMVAKTIGINSKDLGGGEVAYERVWIDGVIIDIKTSIKTGKPRAIVFQALDGSIFEIESTKETKETTQILLEVDM